MSEFKVCPEIEKDLLKVILLELSSSGSNLGAHFILMLLHKPTLWNFFQVLFSYLEVLVSLGGQWIPPGQILCYYCIASFIKGFPKLCLQ